MERKRPTGVTVISILMVIGGITSLILGAILTLAAVIIAQFNPDFVFLLLLGATSIGLGITSFVVAVGLLKGKEWAWVMTFIIAIISIALYILGIALGESAGGGLRIIINGVILYYLYRPNVRLYFGRLKSPPS